MFARNGFSQRGLKHISHSLRVVHIRQKPRHPGRPGGVGLAVLFLKQVILRTRLEREQYIEQERRDEPLGRRGQD